MFLPLSISLHHPATMKSNDLKPAFKWDDALLLEDQLSEDERMVRVVECRIFAGLSESETAEALELPLRSCQRLWADARSRLEVLLAA